MTVNQNINIIPATATGTNDLGSAALPWDNVYGVILHQNGNLVCDAAGNNCPFNGGYLGEGFGALYPVNNTTDLLIGSSATTSAKFAFTGVSSGIPTASISGTTANVATYLTGNGTLSTTNAQNLVLGSSTTGNIILSSRGVTSLTADGANLTAAGTITLPNSNTLTGVSNYLQLANGVSVGGGTTYHFDSTGNIVANDVAVNGGNLTTTQTTANIFTNATTLGIGAGTGTTTVNNTLAVTGNTNLNGDTTIGNAITDNITFTGHVAANSSLIPIGTTGTNDLGSSALPWDNIYGVALYQNGNLVCDAAGNNCPAGSGYWDNLLDHCIQQIIRSIY